MIRDSAPLSRRVLIAGAFGMLTAGRPVSARRLRAHDHAGHQDGPDVLAPQDPSDSSAAKLSKPWLAGQPRDRVEDADNDPFIIAIERRIKCNCGCAHSLYGCRTTDFVCGFWQPLHAEVVEMANRGMSAEEIIDAYVAKHGTEYLMAPPPEGFNLAGYLVPGILITLVGATLAFILRRRTTLASAPEVSAHHASSLSDLERARIAEELEKLES